MGPEPAPFMKLQKLIVLRHGEYEHGGFLTDLGRASIDNLAVSLLKFGHLNTDSMAVLCSRELRAIKSAQVFIGTLWLQGKIDEESHKELYSSDRECDTTNALRVIKGYSDKVETLVVFTHLEMVQEIPRVVGADVPRGYHDVEYAKGFIIDCKAHTCEQI
jgi:phosphohistidine phosphatase SixA